MEHKTYTKIDTLYKRNMSGTKKGRIIVGDYSDPIVEFLKDLPWLWYEKVDGTNFSCYWDGHNKEYHGKAEKSDIKAAWLEMLDKIFTVEKLSKVFKVKYDENGNEIPLNVRIYGELYGKGLGEKNYIGDGYSEYANSNYMFRIFDINIDGWWLEMDTVANIAKELEIEVVPFVGEMTVNEAEKMVINGFKSSIGDIPAEGLVGRIKYGLTKRNGGRIITKIKTRDYRQVGITSAE